MFFLSEFHLIRIIKDVRGIEGGISCFLAIPNFVQISIVQIVPRIHALQYKHVGSSINGTREGLPRLHRNGTV